jgi:nucleoside-diphosphate-sugar epimerase
MVLRGDREGNVPEGVDYIYDLAAYGNLHGQNDLVETYRANVLRLAQLFENAKDYKGLVITSSNSVKLPIGLYYQASKIAAEEMARLVAQKGAPVAIIRPFSVTGIGEQPIHLIPKLIRSCLYDEQIPFVPDSAHDFIDVEDVAKAYILVAKNADKFKGQIFEAGWGRSYSNEQVKDIVEGILDKKANTKPVKSLRVHDTKSYVADNRSLRALGWRPTKPLEQSIKDR